MSTYSDISIYIKNNQGEFELVDKFDYQNYDVFAFVCGIRNYYDIEPISQPRGPLNKVQKEEPKDFYDWASSHDHYDYDSPYTWVTNKEIREHLAKFDQLKPGMFKAFMSYDSYVLWDKVSEPRNYWRYNSNSKSHHYTMEEADKLIKTNTDYRKNTLNLIFKNSEKYQYYFKNYKDDLLTLKRYASHVKPSKNKYYHKLQKYVDRVSLDKYVVYIETPFTSKMMKDNLEWLFNRIKPYEDKYGEIYLEFKFN